LSNYGQVISPLAANCSSSPFYWTISSANTNGYDLNPGSILGNGGPNTNLWQNGTTNIGATFNQAGTYTYSLRITNDCGDDTATHTLCVIQPPTCGFSLSQTSGCSGISAAATNSSLPPSCNGNPLQLQYSWSVSSSNLPGTSYTISNTTATNPNFTFTNTTATNQTFTVNLTVRPINPQTGLPMNSCASACTQTIVVSPQPTFSLQPIQPDSLCIGGTFNALSVAVNYLGTGSPSYQWYSNTIASTTGATLIAGAVFPSYIPPADAVGTRYYYCVVTFTQNPNCTAITSSIIPAVVLADPIAFSNPLTQTICVGGGLPNPLSASYSNGFGAPSYQWSTITNGVSTPIQGANTQTYSPPIFTTANTYNYSVTINTSASGCTADSSDVISVVVINDPLITSQPSPPITYCQNTPAGNIATLSVTATGGSGTFSYQWYVNSTNSNAGGIAVAGATSPTFTPPSITPGTFYYYCIISQPVANCSVASAPSQIIIVESPVFTNPPFTTQIICNGGTTDSLQVTTSGGTGTISYQWYSNTTAVNSGGTIIPGATSNTYTPPNTNSTLPDTTYYYCIVSFSAGGCSNIYSNVGGVIILPDPAIAAQPTSTQTICVGGIAAPLSVSMQTGTGVGAFTYQWYSNVSASNSGGVIIPGATNATYIPPTFNIDDNFYYYCVVTNSGNGCGSVISQVATVIVVQDPGINDPILTTQTLCQNAPASAISVSASGGTGTLSYQWFSNTTPPTAISGANSQTFTPQTAAIGTFNYYCVVTTPVSGCSAPSGSSEVIVNPAPTFNNPPTSSNVCVGGTASQMCATYSGGTGVPSYQWYSNSTNNNFGGTAVVGATDLCFTPSTSAVGTIYYYALVTLVGGGCSSITSSTGQVDVIPDPSILAQPTTTQTICVGGTATPLSVTMEPGTGIGAFSYQWYSNSNPTNIGGILISGATNSTYTPPAFNTVDTLYYYCMVSNAGNGCGNVVSQLAEVIIVDDPAVSNPATSTQTLCQNAPASAISVSASGGTGILSYQWYSNTTPPTAMPGANSQTFTPSTAAIGTFNFYCVVSTPVSGCSATSASSEVNVNPAPTFNNPPASSNVCLGGTVNQMCATYSGGTGTPAYQWYSNTNNINSGGTIISGETNECYTPLASAVGTTYYYAVVTLAGGGCSSITSSTGQVVVTSNTTISLQPNPSQTICAGGSISTPLSVEYSGGTGIPSYQWYSSPSSVAISGATSSTYTPPLFSVADTSSYYVIISLSGAGCGIQSSSIADIYVVEDPTATISSGATYCQNAGSVVPLSVVVSNGQGTPSFQWYSNNTNSNTGGTIISGATALSFSPPVANTGTTYYYCMITQSGTNCAVNSPAVQIIVNPAPTFDNPPASSNVCIGGTANQMCANYSGGTGTPAYQWYSNTLNNNSGGTIIIGATNSCFTPPTSLAGTTYYYVEVALAGGGCSSITSSTGQVIVAPDPSISLQPTTTQTICDGGTIPAPLNVSYAGGVGTPAYQWFSTSPAVAIAGAVNSTYTPPTLFASDTFNYYVTINFTGSGCDALTSANAAVIVIADPLVTVQPSTPQSVCQNTATSQISVNITGGTGNASYQWFSNTTNTNIGGTIISGATSNSYIPPSNIIGTQYYFCAITQTGANCGVSSTPYSVIVNQAPQFSPQPLNTQERCLNASTANLVATFIYGTGTATYQWYSNSTNSSAGGTLMNTETNNIFTPSSNVAGTYYYYCVVSFASGGGCPSITSNVSQVIIHPYPIVAITGGETICLLESSDINFAFTPSSGLYDITYTANGQSTTIENYNGANPFYTVTPSQTTTYVVTNIAYDQVPQCAIQPNTSIVVVVNPLPALNNSNYTFCSDLAGTSIQYTPDANTYTYDWLPNPSANYLGQNNGPSVISVTLPDPVGNAPTEFFYVTNLTNNATGCNALDSILVTINPNPIGTFTLPTIGCINSPIPLSNGDATIGSYEWSIDGSLYSLLANPTPPVFAVLGDHTIEMVAINSYGCTDTLNSVIQIYEQPVANFSTDLNNGCAPLTVGFTNLSTGQYVTSYDWTFAPDTVSWNNTFSSSTLINPPSATYLQGDITTDYIVTLAVTNACGTVTSQQVITVLPTPVANFTLPTHTICSGSTLMVNNISVGEPIGYTWTYGNFTSYNPNLTSVFFPSDSVTHVYPITLTLTNACGTDTYSDSITVLPDNVQGGFTTSIDAGCSPLTVTLNNTTFNTNLSATWHLDDPLNTVISNQNTVQFTYLAVNNISQNYNPYLVVTDGCANDTIYTNIAVFANPIPNISASQINICAGTTVNFSGSITGGGSGFGYAWDFGGAGTSNTQNTSFNFVTGTNVGQNIPVTLTVSSPNNTGSNCTNSVSTIIHVYSNPDLSSVSYNTTDGCSLLNVQVANLPNNLNTIIWGDGITNTSNSHNYLNNTGAVITYNLGINSSITYPTIPNLVCTSTSNQQITIHPTPLPVISSSTINTCEGQLVNFIASTQNNQNSGVGYSWNIGNLSNSTNANTSFNFTVGSPGGLSYPIALSASQTTLGVTCSAIANSSIIVYDTPDLTPITFNSTSGCSNLNVIISNLPSASNQVNWGDGNTNFTNTHTYSNNGTGLLSYPVIVTSTSSYGTTPQLNCTTTSNQVVNVYPTPLPQINSSGMFVCEGSSLDFNASTSNNQNVGISYFWNFGILGTSNLNSESVLFQNGSSTGTQFPIELTAFQTTSGTICSTTVVENITIYETPDLSTAIFNNQTGCSPLLTSIANLPVSTYTYNWGDGVTTSTPNHLYINQSNAPLNYNVTINASNFYPTIPLLTCSSSANATVQVNPQPIAAFTFDQPEACFYPPVNATMQNTSTFAVAPYIWNIGGISYSNSLATYQTTFNSSGIHPVELVATNQFGCTDSITNDFIIYDLPTAQLNIPNNQLCLGTTAQFAVTGTNIATSTWDFGDGTILNLLNPSTVTHYYGQQGVYSIEAILTSNLGCVDTLTFQNFLIVHPTPTASFLTNTLTADIVYPYFEFYNYSVGGTNYNWDFGDSNFSTDSNPTHTYENIDNYLVQLTVSNEYNCFDIATEILHVEGIVVFVPSAFTPLDYNGVNDVFKPSFSSTEGIEFYEFTIYDRWGVKIFQTNDVDEAWIGNSKEHNPGDDNYYAQNDVYTYRVVYRKKARADDPQPDRIVTGHVTIIR
jgi:PKD repeat protein